MKRPMQIPRPRSYAMSAAASLFASLLVLGCGGGGGGDNSPAASASASAGDGAALNTAGAAANVDASYFPLLAGANWLFDVGDKSNPHLGRAQFNVASWDGTNAVVQENDRGTLRSSNFSVDEDGVILNLSWGSGNSVMRLRPRLVSFGGYSVGQTRSANGSASADVDGDTLVDHAEYQLSQVLVGYDDVDDLPVKGGVAHFRNVLTVRATTGGNVVTGETRNEDIWLAPGLGPVKIERNLTDLRTGQTSFARFSLVSAQVGASVFAAP